MTAPLPNAAVLLGRGDGSENPGLVISQRCDFALFKAGRWRPTFCERRFSIGIKNQMGFQRNSTD
jgi:hypothetical protein